MNRDTKAMRQVVCYESVKVVTPPVNGTVLLLELFVTTLPYPSSHYDSPKSLHLVEYILLSEINFHQNDGAQMSCTLKALYTNHPSF